MKQKVKDFLLWIQKLIQVDTFYLAKGGFWSTLNFSVGTILSLILVIAFANFLDKETYGIYKYILSLAGSLGFLTLTGMNTAVIQAVAQGHENALRQSVKIQLRWNILFLAGLLVLSAYYFFRGNNLFGISLLILGFIFPFTTAYNTYGAFLAGKKDFKRGSTYATIVNTIYILSMMAAIFLTQNLLILIAVYALANFLPPLYFYFRTLAIYKLKDSLRPKGNEELFRYGAHLSFINVFSTLSQYVDKIVVFHYLGAVQLAIYSFALIGPERIRGYTKNLASIILPKLADKSLAEIASVFYKRIWQGMILGAVLSLGYIIAAPFIFKLLLPQYLESVIYSQIISLTLIFTVPAAYVGSILSAQKMVKTIYLSSTGAHLAKILLFIALGATWGVWGIVAALFLAHGLGTLYNFFLWQKEVKKSI